MRTRKLRRAIVCAVMGILMASAAHAQTQFGRLIVFGDSLSDGGTYTDFLRSLNLPGGNQVTRFKFTTNPGNVWVDNIADRFGLTLTPNALDGGLNYAEGGARVAVPSTAMPGFSQTPVSVQIDRFLASNGNFAANDIVTVMVGANDLFQAGLGGITSATTALVTQLGRLQAAGAQNIVLMSLPDIGLTPSFGAGSGILSLQGSILSGTFNSTLKQALQGFSGNLLYIDSFTLFREIVASPSTYGLRNITTPACSTQSAGQCTPATTVANGADTYLFADGVHPSAAGHRILADAVTSVLLAPSQISLLPISIEAASRGQQLAYDHRLRPQGGHESETVEFFGGAGYSPFKIDSSGQLNGVDSENKDIYVGGDYQYEDETGFGAVLSQTHTNANFGNESGSYQTRLTTIAAYGRAASGKTYAFLSGSYGWADIDDIRRDVHINGAVRTELGKTKGRASSLKAGAGYDLVFGALMAAPVISLAWERMKVDGYTEEGTSSTQLAFGPQTLSQLTISPGLEVRWADSSSAVQPYIRATYDNDLLHDSRTVSILGQGAVAPFHGAAYRLHRDSGSIVGGTIVRLADSIHATINGGVTFGPSHFKSYGITASINGRF